MNSALKVRRSKGSLHEKSDAILEAQAGDAPSEDGLLKTISLQSLLAHIAEVRGFSLALTPSAEEKHLDATMTTIFSRTCALSAMNLRNASSLLLPRNSWKTNFFTCLWTQSIQPASFPFQNLGSTLPLGVSFNDCNKIKSKNTEFR